MTNYISPLFTVDSVLFTVKDEHLKVLLVRRAIEPYKGVWALPGGYVDVEQDKNTDATAMRKLREKTGVEPAYLEQLQVNSGLERDPRGYSVTLSYFALIGYQQAETHIDTVNDAQWVNVNDLERLSIAFDHRDIINSARGRMVQKALYSMLPVYCLPEKFTIGQFKSVIETIIEKPIQRKSLIRRVQASNMIEEAAEMAVTGKRQAQLYRVKEGVAVYHFQRNLEV